VPLKAQLQDRYSSGFEVEAWSNLPHGSGLSSAAVEYFLMHDIMQRNAGPYI